VSLFFHALAAVGIVEAAGVCCAGITLALRRADVESDCKTRLRGLLDARGFECLCGRQHRRGSILVRTYEQG
jgi:hypothetical protein